MATTKGVNQKLLMTAFIVAAIALIIVLFLVIRKPPVEDGVYDMIAVAKGQDPNIQIDPLEGQLILDQTREQIKEEVSYTYNPSVPVCLAAAANNVNACESFVKDHPEVMYDKILVDGMGQVVPPAEGEPAPHSCDEQWTQYQDILFMTQGQCGSISTPAFRSVCEAVGRNNCEGLEGANLAYCDTFIENDISNCVGDVHEAYIGLPFSCDCTMPIVRALQQNDASICGQYFGGLRKHFCEAMVTKDCTILDDLMEDYTWLELEVCSRIKDDFLRGECEAGASEPQSMDMRRSCV